MSPCWNNLSKTLLDKRRVLEHGLPDLWHSTLTACLRFVCFFKGLPYCLGLPWKCSKDSSHIPVAIATAVFPIMSCIIWTDVTASCSRSHKAPPSIASYRCAVNIKRGWFEQDTVSAKCCAGLNCTIIFPVLWGFPNMRMCGFCLVKIMPRKDAACLNIIFQADRLRQRPKENALGLNI